jgi:hypothetical protein
MGEKEELCLYQFIDNLCQEGGRPAPQSLTFGPGEHTFSFLFFSLSPAA